MDLTSLRRVKYTLGITKADEDQILAALVGTASKQISYWLRRLDQDQNDGLELKSRTEYFDPQSGQRRFYPRAYPLVSIASVYVDWTGLYTGQEILLSSTGYFLDSTLRSFTFQIQPLLPEWNGFLAAPRAMRIVYTAGLAADPVVSAWTKTADAGGTLSVGKYVRGELSSSIGYTRAAASGTISIECLAGKFLEGEVIKEYGRLDGSATDGGPAGDTGVTSTLLTCTARSLAETHPSLVFGCEMHIEHLRKNRSNFDNLTVTENGATRFSRSDMKNQYDFLPEIRSMLQPYQNRLAL